MIYIGLDDTDAPGTVGTKRLARVLAAELVGEYRCQLIVRHQLLIDPRVPCTTKNSTASIMLTARNGASLTTENNDWHAESLPKQAKRKVPCEWSPSLHPLVDRVSDWVRWHYSAGSDPGLCITEKVPAAVTAFGRRCQSELVGQQDARRLAARHGLYLEGFGGTEDGVIGALAAVGLAAEGNDGRVLQVGQWPDDLAGLQLVETLRARGVEVRSLARGDPVLTGAVDVGKRLRPSYRQGRVVLFVSPADGPNPAGWHAVRLT